MAASTSVALREDTSKKKVILQKQQQAVDFSYLKLTSSVELETEEPRSYLPKKSFLLDKSTMDVQEKSDSQHLKINNNSLKEICNLLPAVTLIFNEPFSLTWIDLSMNQLDLIDPVLLKFECLKILHLHGNMICDIKQVKKLAGLKELVKLSLHGNPIDETKGYRSIVLADLPKLISFDFSTVTKGDRVTAEVLRKFQAPKPRKRYLD